MACIATNWTITAGIEQVRFIMQVESTSPAERGLLAELDFFFPACPSALMLSFSAATNGYLVHFDGSVLCKVFLLFKTHSIL